MTYTQLGLLAVVAVAVVDLVALRTALLRRRVFWVSYAIVLVFQLVTNAVLAGTGTVRYADAAVIGSATPVDGPPPFLGDGRIAWAPVEDLLFGFALVLLTQALWVFWGRRGLQRDPVAGPPRVSFAARRGGSVGPDQAAAGRGPGTVPDP